MARRNFASAEAPQTLLSPRKELQMDGATASTPVTARAAKTYNGGCFCGAVELTVTGEPAAMGYCHCESCRSWSAGPVNAFTLWQPSQLKIMRGADNIGTHNKTPKSARKWCKTCGGHLFTEHPHWNLTDVYAARIARFP